MTENKDEVSFGLWNPKQEGEDWPRTGTLKGQYLRDVADFLSAASIAEDVVRIDVWPREKTKETQPDYDVFFSLADSKPITI